MESNAPLECIDQSHGSRPGILDSDGKWPNAIDFWRCEHRRRRAITLRNRLFSAATAAQLFILFRNFFCKLRQFFCRRTRGRRRSYV